MDTERDPAQTTLCDEEKFKDYSEIDSQNYDTITFLTRARIYRKTILALSLIVVLTPIIYFAIHRWTGFPPKFDQCGTTAEEARARGCVFETTGFSWLPKECHDRETEDEFLNFIVSNNLKLYRDMNYTEEVPMEEVRLGDGPGFFVRQQYHLTHCLFLIKKMHRALTSNKAVDGLIKPFHHTEHCIGQLLQPPGFREDDIQLSYTKFPYCGKPGGYNVEWSKQGQWTDY